MDMIYYDNCATTKVLKEVAEVASRYMMIEFENPASPYKQAMDRERVIDNARKTIKQAIGASGGDVFFTSGGTEANNLAIQGAVNKSRKHRIITTGIEHSSILASSRFMGDQDDRELIILGVDEKGYISLEELKRYVNDDTIIVSIMHVNNEIGTVQDIEAIGKLIKEINPDCLFHVDGVQALGKVPVNVDQWRVDMYSMSAHKIHGPKGVGALYVRDMKRIVPLFHGGGQEKGIRPGTSNVPGIAAFERAAAIATKDREANAKHMLTIKTKLWEGLNNEIEGCHLMGAGLDKSAHHVMNVAFEKVRGEVLLHALEQEGVIVNTGSACSSKKKKISRVLTAMGINDRISEGAVRLSFSRFNTLDEVPKAIEIIKRNVTRLRRFT